MSYTTRQVLDVEEIKRQLHSARSGPMLNLLRRGLRVQAIARRRAPADTGRLRQNISIATEPRDVFGVSTFGVIVGTDVKYALWVHNGTGLYGPRHQIITPTRGKLMVFKAKSKRVRDAQGRFVKGQRRTVTLVFTHSTRGQRGVPFLKDALREGVRG